MTDQTIQKQITYAGFWIRVGASLIDGIVMTGISFMAGILFSILHVPMPEVTGSLMSFLIFWIYPAFMESSSKQATIGKMIAGIKVVGEDGDSISFWRATARSFSKYISAILLFIGFLMVAFTAKKQGLHDMIVKTTVIEHSKSNAGKVILILFLSPILFGITFGMLVYFIIWPQITQTFFSYLSSASFEATTELNGENLSNTDIQEKNDTNKSSDNKNTDSLRKQVNTQVQEKFKKGQDKPTDDLTSPPKLGPLDAYLAYVRDTKALVIGLSENPSESDFDLIVRGITEKLAGVIPKYYAEGVLPQDEGLESLDEYGEGAEDFRDALSAYALMVEPGVDDYDIENAIEEITGDLARVAIKTRDGSKTYIISMKLVNGIWGFLDIDVETN
jgi:uncharacterized RDD family membrane protein YckC